MSELFYNAVPNATRVAPPLPTPRHYPAHKPRKVYLFGTCVVDLFFPEAGMDAIHLIEREGIDVDYPQGQSCCGQPAYTSGYTDQARKVARAQLALFAEDYPVVVPSGSCAGMIKAHYPELFAYFYQNISNRYLYFPVVLSTLLICLFCLGFHHVFLILEANIHKVAFDYC